MSEEFKVEHGVKIEPEEAKTLDRSTMGVGTVRAPSADVEGQSGVRRVWCPWCGGMNYCYVSDFRWIWYTCGWCGGGFRV